MSPKTTIEAFEKAVHALAFKGAQMPEAHEEIERNYRHAKQQLYRALGLPPIAFDAEEEE